MTKEILQVMCERGGSLQRQLTEMAGAQMKALRDNKQWCAMEVNKLD